MSIFIYTIFFTSLAFIQVAFANQVKVCADDFRQELKLKKNLENLSIDVLKRGILELKKETDVVLLLEFMPLPRCLDLLKKGKIDAALNLSYNDERAKFLDYPPGSGPEEWGVCTSAYKVACSGYVLITLKSNPYQFNGDKNVLLKPVRVTRGYSIAKELEPIYKKDMLVGKSNLANLQDLLKTQTGSVVANFTFPVNIQKFYEISDQIKIHTKYISMKSYYIPFAKNSKLKKEFRELFWKKVSAVANDTKIIEDLINSYPKN